MGSLVSLISVAFCALAQAEAGKTRGLVEQLGADDIEVRESATARLMEIADPADPDLERAIRGQDPEAAFRARGILRAALFRRGGPLPQVAELLEHGWSAFLDGDLAGTTLCCDALLAADPRFPAARALQQSVREMGESTGDFRDASRQIRLMQAEAEIHLRAFRLPSRAGWPVLSTSLTSAFWRAQHPGWEQPVTVQASSEEMEKIIREIARGRTKEDEAKITGSGKHYELALTYHHRGEFEKAGIEAAKAVETWHENVAARKLLNDVNRITRGGKAESDARSITEDVSAPLLSMQLEIGKHVRDGERYFNAGMYAEALREFENAEFKLQGVSSEVKAAEDLLRRLKDSMLKSRNALRVEAERVIGPGRRE